MTNRVSAQMLAGMAILYLAENQSHEVRLTNIDGDGVLIRLIEANKEDDK